MRTALLSAVIAVALLPGCAEVHATAPLAGAPAAAPAGSPFQVRVAGHGPPMLLIPGLSSAGEVWDGVVARYQDRFECHVLTLAGFAGQPAIAAPFLSTERDAILRYIEEKHLEHPLIVGHSLGGVLALMIAEKAPDKPSRLVLVDSLPFLPAAFDPSLTEEGMRPRAEQIRQVLRMQTVEERRRTTLSSLRTMITDPAKIELAARWGAKSDPETVSQVFYELSTTDLRPGLSAIASPTLVIGTWNGRPQANRQLAERIYRSQYQPLRGAKLVMADTAKHFVMWDDPAALYREMDSFLAAPAPASVANR